MTVTFSPTVSANSDKIVFASSNLAFKTEMVRFHCSKHLMRIFVSVVHSNLIKVIFDNDKSADYLMAD